MIIIIHQSIIFPRTHKFYLVIIVVKQTAKVQLIVLLVLEFYRVGLIRTLLLKDHPTLIRLVVHYDCVIFGEVERRHHIIL